jgi:hypothetical protein
LRFGILFSYYPISIVEGWNPWNDELWMSRRSALSKLKIVRLIRSSHPIMGIFLLYFAGFMLDNTNSKID